MPSWKKVITSGSDAHLNHITASGNISSSGDIIATGDLNLDGKSHFEGNITASGNISSSGDIINTGNITTDGILDITSIRRSWRTSPPLTLNARDWKPPRLDAVLPLSALSLKL